MGAMCSLNIEALTESAAFEETAFGPAFVDGFVSLLADTQSLAGIRSQRGIIGSTPKDRVEGPGTLEFTLQNHAGNSGGLQGWYSPNHANCRSGWTYGVPIRLVLQYLGIEYPVWWGRLATIDPIPGKYRSQLVSCIAHGAMATLTDVKLRSIAAQQGKTEAELLTEILAAVPAEALPPATDLDLGLDTFTYALDRLGSGVSARTPIYDVVLSALGKCYVKGDGTLRYENRHTTAARAVDWTFNDDMYGLEVPSDLSNVYNRVRVTTHQKLIDAATGVLAEISNPVPFSANETKEFWLTYAKPGNPEQLLGGVEFIEPLDAYVDYDANTVSGGGGVDLTGEIVVTADFFATTVKMTVVWGATAGYLNLLQGRGKGINDIGPMTWQHLSAESYGDRPLDLDLRYQDNSLIGQGIADYLWAGFHSPLDQSQSIRFLANASAAFMQAATQAEIGDRIRITETMTGLVSVDAFIQSISLEIGKGPSVWVTWGLMPRGGGEVWILEDPEASKLDYTTILGYV